MRVTCTFGDLSACFTIWLSQRRAGPNRESRPMRRFVLRQNIARFRTLLAVDADSRTNGTVRALLAGAERELALLDADDRGAVATGAVRGPADGGSRGDREFARHFEKAAEKYLLIDPNPGLHIVDLNDAYAQAIMADRGRIAGERLFDLFPDNPDDPHADGVSNVFRSLQTVVKTRRRHRMPIQRYDIRDAEGRFVVRYWRSENSPLFSDDGALIRILHRVEDVTEDVLAAASGRGKPS